MISQRLGEQLQKPLVCRRFAFDSNAEGVLDCVNAGVCIIHQDVGDRHRLLAELKLCSAVEHFLNRGDEQRLSVEKVIGQSPVGCGAITDSKLLRLMTCLVDQEVIWTKVNRLLGKLV